MSGGAGADRPGPMRLMGYTDRLSACPGDRVAVMVSSAATSYDARLVRLIHGDVHPDGPGYKAMPVPSSIDGPYPGRRQELRRGSHLAVDSLPRPSELSLAVWVWPTSLGPRERGLLGYAGERGTALTLDPAGRVALWLDGRAVVRSEAELRLGEWALVVATVGAETARVGVGTAEAALVFADAALEAPVPAGSATGFQVGACGTGDHFNGKLEDPVVYARALAAAECEALRADADPAGLDGLLASWRLGADLSTRRVADAGGHGHDGRLVNLPTRAVTGRRWAGVEVDFRRVPDQYGAAHFHDDDLDDAEWEQSFAWEVPGDLASGVYAFELRAGDDEDVVPVFVRPPRGRATAPVALLLPTFSYLAYGNEHVFSDPAAQDFYRSQGCTVNYPVAPQDVTIVAEQLHSLYDHHSDGSGVSYSSWLRPLLSMRPKYHEPDLSLGRGAAHQLNADLHLVDWLHEQGQPFDVITDGDLHEEGVELLERYRVVITGTHPEYVSERILDGIEAYLQGGGRMMYLGGNGFYWVTELEPEERHTIEVRRWGAATRLWDARAGEWHLASTGTLGGIWRFRGRPPQRLFGVGFTAMGSGVNRPYRRAPESYDGPGRWVFDGLPDERAEFGDQPALVNDWGVAGFEVDRFDPELGSPRGTVVLASATEFSDHYQHVVDEVLMSDSLQGGSVNPLVRADMVLVPYPHGGAVFSPGSIAWCSGLSHNDYDNPVATITANVLDRLLASGDLFAAPGPRT